MEGRVHTFCSGPGHSAVLVDNSKKIKLFTFGYNVDMSGDREVVTGQLGVCVWCVTLYVRCVTLYVRCVTLYVRCVTLCVWLTLCGVLDVVVSMNDFFIFCVFTLFPF